MTGKIQPLVSEHQGTERYLMIWGEIQKKFPRKKRGGRNNVGRVSNRNEGKKKKKQKNEKKTKSIGTMNFRGGASP